jgi:hypothetical protein
LCIGELSRRSPSWCSSRAANALLEGV